MPGTARDGSKCYTRTNNAGGKYTTCEGEQKRNRKVQREISKLHERTRVKVTKDEFNEARTGLQQTLTRPSGEAAPQVLIPQVRDERIDTKVRQLDGRSWQSGLGRAKNPHTWIAMGPDGRATSEALMKVVYDYESGVLSKTEVNTVIYRASQIILDERAAEGALAGLQTDYQQGVDDIALQTTAALDRVFNFEVAEAPGVVAMTSTMSPLGQATFDALLGMGFDVSAGISAAVAAREEVLPGTKDKTNVYIKFRGLSFEEDDWFDGLKRLGWVELSESGLARQTNTTDYAGYYMLKSMNWRTGGNELVEIVRKYRQYIEKIVAYIEYKDNTIPTFSPYRTIYYNNDFGDPPATLQIPATTIYNVGTFGGLYDYPPTKEEIEQAKSEERMKNTNEFRKKYSKMKLSELRQLYGKGASNLSKGQIIEKLAER